MPKIADFANKNGLFANISFFALFPIANMAGGRSAFYKVGVGDGAPGHSPRFRVDPTPLPRVARHMAAVAQEAPRRLA